MKKPLLILLACITFVLAGCSTKKDNSLSYCLDNISTERWNMQTDVQNNEYIERCVAEKDNIE